MISNCGFISFMDGDTGLNNAPTQKFFDGWDYIVDSEYYFRKKSDKLNRYQYNFYGNKLSDTVSKSYNFAELLERLSRFK